MANISVFIFTEEKKKIALDVLTSATSSENLGAVKIDG